MSRKAPIAPSLSALCVKTLKPTGSWSSMIGYYGNSCWITKFCQYSVTGMGSSGRWVHQKKLAGTLARTNFCDLIFTKFPTFPNCKNSTKNSHLSFSQVHQVLTFPWHEKSAQFCCVFFLKIYDLFFFSLLEMTLHYDKPSNFSHFNDSKSNR